MLIKHLIEFSGIQVLNESHVNITLTQLSWNKQNKDIGFCFHIMNRIQREWTAVL